MRLLMYLRENILKTNGLTFKEVNKVYQKLEGRILLTTGTTKRNCTQNIYDLAGNAWEWTLEHSKMENNPYTDRGGGFRNEGTRAVANFHGSEELGAVAHSIAFRIAMF